MAMQGKAEYKAILCNHGTGTLLPGHLVCIPSTCSYADYGWHWPSWLMTAELGPLPVAFLRWGCHRLLSTRAVWNSPNTHRHLYSTHIQYFYSSAPSNWGIGVINTGPSISELSSKWRTFLLWSMWTHRVREVLKLSTQTWSLVSSPGWSQNVHEEEVGVQKTKSKRLSCTEDNFCIMDVAKLLYYMNLRQTLLCYPANLIAWKV